jgi:chloride channel protein, CIC family
VTPEQQPLAGAAYLRLVLIGAALGIPAALLAAGFLALVHQLEDVLWDDLPDALGYSSAPWFLILGIPIAGALVVIVARRFLPGDGGHDPLAGLSMAPTALAAGPGVALAAIGTLSFGLVLGPEAPLIALGSVVGVATARLVKLGQRENAVLSTAGSFSAISALFGGPLPAGVLLVEAGVGLGAALIPVILPGLVAAACGYVVFLGLGNWAGLQSTTLIVPDLPAYDGTSVPDLLLAIAVGIGTGVLVIGARKLGQRVQALRGRGVGMPVLLIAGALAVGCLTLIADALGGDSPEVLFSGQAALPEVLAEGSAGVLIAILLAKVIAYGICLGCGFRGGPVFPAIFTGVALATLAVVAFDTSPTLAVAIGTAAGMAAATRLLISSLVIAALLVGSNGFDAISAAVLAAATAWLVARVLDPPPEPAPAQAPPPAPA